MSENFKITRIEGCGIPVAGNDIDTDRIIPARFLKCVTFDDLKGKAFYDDRFNSDGDEKAHSFNENQYENASILIVNKNFGCGSSREHAPQALHRSGINAIIGESFAEIFAGNCTAIGLAAVTASSDNVKLISEYVQQSPNKKIEIDLEDMSLKVGDFNFEIAMPESDRFVLKEGKWDSTVALMANKKKVDDKVKNIPYMVWN